MKRVLGLVLATVMLLPATATGSEPIEMSEFANAIKSVSLEVEKQWPKASHETLQAVTGKIADRHRLRLLDIVPDECYLEAYGLAWVLWADLRAVADAPDDDRAVAALEAMLARDRDLVTAMDEWDCRVVKGGGTGSKDARNKRKQTTTSFENFDQKANQLYNILSTVLKSMNEMRMGVIKNMQ
jgi:hypothetical protein